MSVHARSRQPTEAVPLNRSTPLARGLSEVLLSIRGGVWDYTAGRTIDRASTNAQYRANSAGRAVYTNGSQTNSHVWKAVSGLPTDFSISMLWVGRALAPATDGRVFALGYSGSNNPILSIGAASSTALRVFLRSPNGTVATRDIAGMLSANRVDAFLITASTSSLRTYRAGALVDSANISGTDATPFDRLAIGVLLRAAAGTPFAGETNLGAVWTRSLIRI